MSYVVRNRLCAHRLCCLARNRNLVVNTITNLSLSCGTIILGPSAGLVMVFFGPVIEAAIMLIEGIVYAITLRDKDGQKRTGRAFLYSLVANLLSAVMGVVVALFLII